LGRDLKAKARGNTLRLPLARIGSTPERPRSAIRLCLPIPTALRSKRRHPAQDARAPEDLIKYWVGHAGESITDSYCKLKEDVAFRKEVTERVGIGFKLSEEKVAVVPNVPKSTSKPAKEMAVSA